MTKIIFRTAMLFVAAVFSTAAFAQNTKQAKPKNPINPSNAAIVLVDHQPGVLAMVGSQKISSIAGKRRYKPFKPSHK